MRKLFVVLLGLFVCVRSETKIELPALPYDYDALEPILSEHLMKLHHGKHHRTYAEKTNDAFKQMSNDENETSKIFANEPIETILSFLNEIPEKFRLIFRQSGGGFVNHKLFFSMLRSPTEKNEPQGEIRTAIETKFESFENFRKLFAAKALSVFGSGWLWLYVDGQTNELVINSTANQDNPIMFDRNHRVVLGLDLWEHAYYPVYENRRNEYVENFWQIVNWPFVAELFSSSFSTRFEL